MRTRIALGLLLCVLSDLACKGEKKGYQHSSEHPEGHDHHEPGHGHGAEPVWRITLWNEQFELFAEHAPLVVGETTTLLAHVTVLDGSKPLTGAQLRLELAGPSTLTGAAEQAVRPGIYELSLTPKAPGKYLGTLSIAGPVSGAVEGIEIAVYASDEKAHAAAPKEDHGAPIEFLKEQQWSVPFASAVVTQGSLVASIEIAGTVDTPPGGRAEVGAAIAGRVVAPQAGLPLPGDVVQKGALLASLWPSPSSPEDAARASLVAAEAQARATAARAALDRSERLLVDQAISQRELEDAHRELHVAQEAVAAARRAADLFSGTGSGRGQGAFRLVAPIGGTLVSVKATPGATVAAGEVLFTILDARELWIRARVPEQDAARLRTDRNARFQIAGLSTWQTIDIRGTGQSAKLVTVGRTVDAVSRTVDVIYALRDPDPALRVGGLLQVSLPTGEDFAGVVIPRAAILDHEGRQVVYVQLDGEHFAQRAVRVGPRAGDLAGIVHGLEPGERIVTTGAPLVRMTDRPQSSEPHGHIH